MSDTDQLVKIEKFVTGNHFRILRSISNNLEFVVEGDDSNLAVGGPLSHVVDLTLDSSLHALHAGDPSLVFLLITDVLERPVSKLLIQLGKRRYAVAPDLMLPLDSLGDTHRA